MSVPYPPGLPPPGLDFGPGYNSAPEGQVEGAPQPEIEMARVGQSMYMGNDAAKDSENPGYSSHISDMFATRLVPTFSKKIKNLILHKIFRSPRDQKQRKKKTKNSKKTN